MTNQQVSAIEKFVAAQRKALRADVESQLHGYGIQTSGELLPVSSLDHLPEDERQTADQLRQRLTHLKASQKPSAAFNALAREQAFTILNRIVALRMAEERGIILPAVSVGLGSEGFQNYLQTADKSALETFGWYREYLFALFDELSLELPVLFDRFRGEGLIFPSQDALLKLIEAMSSPDLSDVWSEDETIGWIYQYFNDPKQRKKLRENTAPTNSYELAVRNQFFTPRYVVRFLVDNSLGRLWVEQTNDREALKNQCEMLALSPEEQITPSPGRDPRTLKVIDPACGSMHFGLYAFDVLAEIYQDAWNRAFRFRPGHELQRSYPEIEGLQRAIPRLICEENLYGIDIDARAVQISGITLWLRAHRWWHELGMPAADRPQIRRFNLATAQPMPGEREFYTEFLGQLSPAPLQRLAEVVWNELKLAGEVGSLLRVEATVNREIDRLRKSWEKIPEKDKKQGWFLAEDKADYTARRYGVDLSEIKKEDDWAELEQKVFEAVETFARTRRSGPASYQRSLFADDTMAGFALIDVLRPSFDVVLMNPPFGASATGAKKYISDHYPRTKNDLYAAFVEGFLRRLRPGGYLGAITSRTGLFLSSFKAWREEILLKEAQPIVLADLGFGVLDAMVETAAYVLKAR